MKITDKVINYLYESEEIDPKEIALDLYNSYYDKDNNKYTKDLTSEIAKRCNYNNEDIKEVNNELEELISNNIIKNDNIEPELEETGEKIVKILNNYGIKVEFINAKKGPRVTLYEFNVAPGTKINQITNLNKEIAMGLAVDQVLISPVEGSTTLGIQVPNKESSNVSLSDVMEDSDKSGVSMALGKDTNGNSVAADILKLQHILIGGTTGSGKSSCINSIICSLIDTYSPDIVKLILIDPKKVELSAYKSIPHLYMPIITDPDKAAEVLNELTKLMDKRYSDFEKVGVKNIEGYNDLVERYNSTGKSASKMPYIIVIIDELADLMQVAGKQVEASIQRLTQLARAAGIHLIVATQRPSVDVITGVIKSNINSRIAFATPSSVDSRTILDQGGAEKLLGKGDMLYKPLGASNAKRVQGAYISDDEINNIVNKVNERYGSNKQQNTEHYEEDNSEKEDINYKKALQLVQKLKKITTSALQLGLHIPYSEATRIINKMRENGIIK